jgi:hypothetical protein
MAWYALRPRDPADPRWPLPDSPVVTLKADDADEARAKFVQAYPSEPFGTPESPVANAGQAGFAHDADALLVEETSEPASPPK